MEFSYPANQYNKESFFLPFNAEKFIPRDLLPTICQAYPQIISQNLYQQYPQQFQHSQYIYNNSTSSQQLYAKSQVKQEEIVLKQETLPKSTMRLTKENKNISNEDLDDLIISLGQKYKNDWKRVTKQILKMTGKKIGPNKLKDHFKSLTRGTLPKRVKFTHEEDMLIARYYETYGVDWAKISTFFPNRSDMMIKNRFYSHIKKKNLLDDLLLEVNQNKFDKIENVKSSHAIKQEEEVKPFDVKVENGYTESENYTLSNSSQEGNEYESPEYMISYENDGDQEKVFSDYGDDCFSFLERSFKNELSD